MNKLSKSSVIKACAKAQLEANVWRENLNRATGERDKVKAATEHGIALGKVTTGKEWLHSGKDKDEVFEIDRKIHNEVKSQLRDMNLNGADLRGAYIGA